jgi:hypothetical protein
MNESPRLNQNRRTSLQTGTFVGSEPSASAYREDRQSRAAEGAASQDHSPTTATGTGNHSPSPYQLDIEITRALTELAVLPGNVSGTGFESHVASAERGIPVGKNGNAKGDVSLADLQRRASRARSVMAKQAVLDAIREEISSITVGRRTNWYDLGTKEGRIKAGEFADRVGIREAARSLDRPKSSVDRWHKEYVAWKGAV